MIQAIFLRPLAWIGGQGAVGVILVLPLAMLVPPLGRVLVPWLTEAVLLLLVIAFVRLDLPAVRANLRRPGLVLAAVTWTSLAVPALLAGVLVAVGVHEAAPALFLGLLLQGVASPMMAAPALAALAGLDSTLILIVMLVSSVLVPLTAPPLVAAFADGSVSLDAAQLSVRLALLIAASAALGLTLRAALGAARVARHSQALNGANLVVMFVFAAAVMESVPRQIVADPLRTLAFALVATAAAGALFIATAALFWRCGRAQALALGLMASQRNMGLMIAGTAGGLPELTWLYFALSQIPIHLAPWLVLRATRAP